MAPSSKNKDDIHPFQGLREQENEFRLLFEEAPLAYQSLLPDGTIRIVNRAWCEMTGLTRGEAAGRYFGDLMDSKEQLRFRKNFNRFKQSAGVFKIESGINHKDGRKIQVALDGHVIRDVGGAYKYSHCILKDITVEKELRKELADQAQKFHTLFDVSADALILAEAGTGRIIHANQAASVLLEKPVEQIIGMLQKELFPEEQLIKANEAMAVRPEDDPQAIPPVMIEIICPGGKRKPVEFTEKAFEINGTQYVLGNFRDLSNRLAEQERLRQSEERFRMAFDHSGIGMALASPEGTFLKVNNALNHILGYGNEELVGKNVAEVAHPDDIERYNRQRIQRLQGGGGSFQLEKRYIHKAGHTIWSRINLSTVNDPDGKPVYIIAQIQDITAQKETGERLAESEEKFRLLFETSGMGIGYYDLEGKLIHFNPVAAARMGGTPEQFTGQTMKQMFGKEGEVYHERLRRAMKAREALEFNDRLDMPGGIRWFNSIYTPVLSGNGEIRGVQVISHDITESKLAHSKLELLNGLNIMANEGASLERIADRLSMRLNAVFGLKGSALYILDKTGDFLEAKNTGLGPGDLKAIEKTIGMKIPEIRIRLKSDSWYRSCLESRQPQIVNDPESIKRIITEFTGNRTLRRLIPSIIRKLGIEYVMGVPLRVNGRPVGLLELSSQEYIDDATRERIVRISDFIANIVSRKLSDEALAEEEEKYRMLHELAPIGIATVDLKGYVRSVNRAITEITGYSSPEILGKHVKDLPAIEEGSIREYLRLLNSIFKKRREAPVEFTLIDKEGTCRHCDAHFSLIRKNGRINGIQVVVIDTTVRKRSEALMRKSSIIIESTSDSVISTDVEGFITAWNKGARRVFGYAGEEMLGKSIKLLYKKENLPLLEAMIGGTLDGTGPAELEVTCLNKRGNDVHILLSLTALKDEQGSITEIVGIAKDITARIQEEKRLKLQSRFDELLSGISTDFIHVHPLEMEQGMRKALEKVGRSLDLDGCSIGALKKGEDEIVISEAWNRPGAKGFADRYSLEECPCFGAPFMTGKTLIWKRSGESVKALSAEELLLIEQTGTDSVKIVPLVSQGDHFQCMILIKDSADDWTDLFYDRIVLLGHIFGNALLRKQAELSVIKSEEKYRTLFQNMAQGVFYQNADGHIVDVNRAALKIFGITKGELLGRTSMNPEWRVVNEHGETLPGERHPSMVSLKTGKKLKDRVIGIFNPKLNRFVWLAVNTHPQFRPGEEHPCQVFVTFHDLTEIRLAREAALKERDRASQCLEIAASIIVALDSKGNVSMINDNGAKLLGFNKKEVIGMNWFERFIPSDHQKEVKGEFLALMHDRKDRPVYFENPVRVKSGKIRFIRWYSSILRDSQGRINGTLSSGEDVTDRRIAEQALIESKARYKDLVEKSGVAIVMDDREGNISFFNRDFASLFGYRMDEMKQITRADLFRAEDIRRIDSYHQLRMRGKRAPNRYEVKGIRKEGSEIWIEVKTTVLKEHGNYTGTRNYIWDITERKLSEQVLAESEVRFRELFSKMNSGVIILEFDAKKKDCRIRDLNRAAESILGIRSPDVVSGYLFRDIPQLAGPEVRLMILQAISGGGSSFFPISLFKEKKLLVYLENHLINLPSGEVVLIFDDFTERITYELELRKSYTEIKKLSRHIEEVREEERKQMARNLHDELGQMLTAVKMDVSWIRNNLQADQEILASRSDAALEIINRGFSGIQRMTTELRPPVLENLGLYEALKSLVAEFQNRSNMITELELPLAEAKFSEEFKITIYRIIQEGLNNILRHSRATMVSLTLMEKSDTLEIELKDNGAGIPKDKVESSDSLGLIGIKERVLHWNGVFEVSGKEGEGTTLRFRMPLPVLK
jgi:PAS domain S-box-containing protein